MAKRAGKEFRKPPFFKLVAFDWNAREFLMNLYVQNMTSAERGELVTAIAEAMHDGKEIKMPWIGKAYWQRVVGRSHVPMGTRRKVMKAGKCKKCGSAERLQLDHKKPIARGGTNDIKNLQVLCWLCNIRKGANWPS